MYDPIETQARQQIRERVSRAGERRMPSTPQRHRLASQLRRIADRLDH